MTKSLPTPLYKTDYGSAYLGDSLKLLDCLEGNSVDLVITSPPFALLRQKEYGNEVQEAYVDWLVPFAEQVKRVLKKNGSFVLDLGGAYQKGKPVRSLYNYRVLIRLCDEVGFNLAEEFFWYNPAKLPSPIEWVNKRKIRAKDAVDTVWWFSKTNFPKADVKKVLVSYSDRMKKLIKNKKKFYEPKKRPSGHDISDSFGKDRGGAIPSNLLEIPNTRSNTQYLILCKTFGIKPHPARFPKELPEFFIKFLTDPDDLVLDIFAGSNTTGFVAEELKRNWMAFEIERPYLSASVLRFIGEASMSAIKELFKDLSEGEVKGIIIPKYE